MVEGGSLTVTVGLSDLAPADGTAVNIMVEHGTSGTLVTMPEDFMLTVSTPGMNGEGTLTGSDPNYVFTIPEGSSSATFTVTVASDAVTTPNPLEIASFILQSGSGYTIGTSPIVAISIFRN